MTGYDSAELRELARRLQDADAGARRVAVIELAESAHERGAGALLLTALQDPDPGVRAEAARVIDEFPTEELTESLVGVLTAADDNVRSAAAKALSDLKDPAAGPALLAALDGASDPFVIAAVLRSLRNLRHEPALHAGLRLIGHEHPAVRQEAVGLLGYLRRPETIGEIARLALSDSAPEVRRQAVAALVIGTHETVGAPLVRTLTDPDWQVRAESAYVIGRLKVPDSVAALVAATGDSNWQVSQKAVEALGQLGARQALPAISRCAASEVSNLRKAAVTAIGEIGHLDGQRYLEPALTDPDPDVRKLARWALGRLGCVA